ncbi:hypothetical protein HMPREF0322_04444 [Desulfitobacterium hafniense DP7]|uniref:Uncharacterized protein n=2 Tax=Desulfitobacterium hafniense TaxID=49338 RepID=Q24NA0_DESHY|nr:hypothetical protein HMPREF0322_04444 [Desulfitobacterium hafniense DP7]BAE86492.1 hypothetical protein DSY4703 [Desulfitobacterium hafniense Y51]
MTNSLVLDKFLSRCSGHLFSCMRTKRVRSPFIVQLSIQPDIYLYSLFNPIILLYFFEFYNIYFLFLLIIRHYVLLSPFLFNTTRRILSAGLRAKHTKSSIKIIDSYGAAPKLFWLSAL